MAGQELKEALASVEQQHQQFAELPQEQRHPDPAVPITFTKVLKMLLIKILLNRKKDMFPNELIVFVEGQPGAHGPPNGDESGYSWIRRCWENFNTLQTQAGRVCSGHSHHWF